MAFMLLHPREIEKICREKNAVIIDIRKQTQYRQDHYKNAQNMTYQDCEKWLNCFMRGRCYIIYCEYGNTSLLVARELEKKGICAYTVVGGWQGICRYYQQSKMQ